MPVPKEENAEETWTELAEFVGDRSRQMLFAAGGPGGGLLFRPVVKDWAATVDLSESHGEQKFRLRALDGEGKIIRVLDKEALSRALLAQAPICGRAWRKSRRRSPFRRLCERSWWTAPPRRTSPWPCARRWPSGAGGWC